jgi:putative MFS transporter
MLPYAAEIFPAGLAGSGTGLSQASQGVARIVSPMLLTLFAGGSAVIAPARMVAALFPTLITMAFFMLGAGLAYTVLAVETRGKAVAEF